MSRQCVKEEAEKGKESFQLESMTVALGFKDNQFSRHSEQRMRIFLEKELWEHRVVTGEYPLTCSAQEGKV